MAALPDYARQLAAYHRAYCVELREMLGALPLKDGDRVLDLACGDGAYACWLAERVGPSGSVVALDISSDWLYLARQSFVAHPDGLRIDLGQADVQRLPFPDNSFDAAWCAQSLYSLPSAAAALGEAVRVVRPGGVVALLENDTLHHLLLPWPVELELEVRLAELEAFRAQTSQPRKFYVGRRLSPLLREAGLEHIAEKAWASVHQPPLTDDERLFLSLYLVALRDRVAQHLRQAMLERLDRLVEPTSPNFLLDQPDVAIVCLDRLVWGVKPGVC